MRTILALGVLLSGTTAYARDCSLLTNIQLYTAIVKESRQAFGAAHKCMCPGDRIDGRRCMERHGKNIKCLTSDVSSNDVVVYCSK
jgi:hypothetical protein